MPADESPATRGYDRMCRLPRPHGHHWNSHHHTFDTECHGEPAPPCTATPELDKLAKINEQGDNQIIGAFLEWAKGHGYRLTKTVTYTDERTQWHNGETYEVPVDVQEPVKIEDALAHYFDIDLDKVSAEKEALYRSLRQDSSPLQAPGETFHGEHPDTDDPFGRSPEFPE